MTGDRTDYVLGLTDAQRIAALVRLGALRPEVFDEIVREDTERQRAIRAHRERRAHDSGEDGGDD